LEDHDDHLKKSHDCCRAARRWSFASDGAERSRDGRRTPGGWWCCWRRSHPPPRLRIPTLPAPPQVFPLLGREPINGQPNGDADALPNLLIGGCPEWSLLGNSGQKWILARDGLSANDAVDGARSAVSKSYSGCVESESNQGGETTANLAAEALNELARTRRRNAGKVDPGIGRTRLGHRTLKCRLRDLVPRGHDQRRLALLVHTAEPTCVGKQLTLLPVTEAGGFAVL
jgi:hypothetical protein